MIHSTIRLAVFASSLTQRLLAFVPLALSHGYGEAVLSFHLGQWP